MSNKMEYSYVKRLSERDIEEREQTNETKDRSAIGNKYKIIYKIDQVTKR